eukprot:TRINITY_DN44143_c0_g1_i1.p1 TRINITY_DN44143_c0_g1~~TRINITY_DN44143_c0_g1_i1.p1  ORF type:complete len:881 (+),score=280.53 TRINITY_DN44143_c0_g1_i1:168-2810(+)
MSVEEMAMSPMALEALERDVHEFLKEISEDDSLERFRLEYKKLHRALKKSHESEKRLIKKCQDLSAEIVANAQKVQTALKLSQEDQGTILSMKKEIEKAWKMVDAAHEKEARAKDTIQQLKKEISNLSQLVEQGAGLTMGQENTVNELIKVKNDLTKERETLNTQIARLRTDVRDQMSLIRRLEQDVQQRDAASRQSAESLTLVRADLEMEKKKRDRAEAQAAKLNAFLAARQAEVNERQSQITALHEVIERQKMETGEARAATDRVRKDNEALQSRLQQHIKGVQAEVAVNTSLIAQVSQQKTELNLRDYEIAALRQGEAKLVKQKDAQTRQVRSLQEEKESMQRQLQDVRQQTQGLEKQILNLTQARDQVIKQNQELLRERDVKQKALLKEAAERHKAEDGTKVHERRAKGLQQEIAGHRLEAHQMRTAIYRLEKERESYASAAAEATSKYFQALEEVKIRQIAVVDLQKVLAEAEARLRQQQALYEGVRAERNVYSKNLLEATDEVGEMKRKFRILAHQVDQLKDEVAAKDRTIAEERTVQKKKEKEAEAHRAEIAQLRQQSEAAAAKVAKLDQSIAQLHQVVSDLENERLHQRQRLQVVVQERDAFSCQLVRRNAELSLLQEKMKILQSALNKGEVQYRDRLVDVRVLRLKIWDLKRTLHLAHGHIASVEALKRETLSLQKQLLAEQTRVKRLTVELESPQNVHRWRRLEGGDARELDVVQKVQALQKRLIAKTEECVERDMMLKEKDRLYQQLKAVLARQPGPEVAEQLNVYHETLRKRNSEMKRLASELNVASMQTTELQYEFERRTRELQEFKRKFFEERLRNQLLVREKALIQAEVSAVKAGLAPGQMSSAAPAGVPRFAGGGFPLGATAPA